MHRGGGNARITSHNQDFSLIETFNNLAPWGEKKFVSELKRTYKFQRGVYCHTEDNSPKYRMVGEILSILRSFAVQTRIFAKECNIIAVGYVRSTAQEDENLNRLRNKSAMTCDLFPRQFGERVRERGYLAASLLCRLAAFTLAEVLITLGIIGVVAAMTIPSLIQNYQEKVLANQFKKSYSMFSQVLNQVWVDNDMSVPICYYNQYLTSYDFSACNEVSAAVLKKLNVVKTCEKKSYENGCIPKYSGLNQSYLGGFTQDWILNHSKSYVLADGTIILEYGLHDSFPAIFAIDINGKKAPNKWGYDLFSFWTISNGGYYILQGTSYSVEDGGKTTNQMMKN